MEPVPTRDTASARIELPPFDPFDLINPERYQSKGYPHREWTWMRAHRPVFRVECERTRPFWAITKAADIIEISTRPHQWRSAPRFGIFLEDKDHAPPANPLLLKHLVNMDPPQHGAYRSVLSARFSRRGVRWLEPHIERITCEVLDSMSAGMRCDFVTDIAAKIPLAVIASMFGIPREDWPRLFQWTNEITGRDDPEFQTGSSEETYQKAAAQAFQYFTALIEERRKRPSDDITGTLAKATVNGNSIDAFELMSYLLLLIVAGNETTRNAISGGILAFTEFPKQFERLKSGDASVAISVDEILRWTSPGIQFARTAVADSEIRGQKIAAGESVCLFYPSANRDEEVFDSPFEFDVTRDPNPHLAFGIGEHFCLGSSLARLELTIFFREFIRRVKKVELDGPVQRLRSSFIGGIKRLPIRLAMS